MVEDRYINEHDQMFPLSARGMTQAMLRDAVGCLCMAAETLLAIPEPNVAQFERSELKDLLIHARGMMLRLGGPEVLLPGQVSLTERDLGAGEMIDKLIA